MIYTLTNVLEEIHLLVEGDVDYPVVGEEDYTARVARTKLAINNWDSQEGILWEELCVKLADATDGDKITAASTLAYDCPTDFRFPGGLVSLNNGEIIYKIVKSNDPILTETAGTEYRYCYFTGNKKTGKKLNFAVQPEVGLSIDYPYYKDASIPTVGTDVIEMSDPQYITHWAAAMEIVSEDPELATTYRQIANTKMAAMTTQNTMPTWGQFSGIRDNFIGFGS